MTAARSGWMPGRDELLDGFFTCVLTVLGLLGFRHVFGGSTYLLMGLVGLFVGLSVAHAVLRTSLPAPFVLVAAALAALLLGAVPLNDTAALGFLPSPTTVRGLAHTVVHGWKQLLTTVRPVGDAGHLLALPYLLGMFAAASAYALARRTRPLAAPLLPLVVVGALSILFGGDRPEAAVAQGAAFACTALAWVAVRRSRQRLVLARGSRRLYRLGAATLLLSVSFATAAVAGPELPFATARPRTVLHAVPPVDLSVFPSPLAAFRRYTKAVPPQQSLADRTLFTVSGAAADDVVRIVALDQYDGKVWGASNRAVSERSLSGFARVGASLPSRDEGSERTASIVIGEGYRDVWLPTVGDVQHVTLGGARRTQVKKSLRFNLATRTGVVPIGLREGDVVEMRTRGRVRLSDAELRTAEPEGTPTLDPAAFQFVAAPAAKFSEGEQTPMGRVLGIAAALHGGSYTHGIDAVQSDPGHGTGRIGTFLQAHELIGDDEQYGAAMALMANAVGVPARVVLVARPRPDGTVQGSDVQVGVELAVAGRGWVPFDTDRFTPPRTKKPVKQPKPVLPKVLPKVVPPPVRPPLSGSLSSTDAEALGDRKAPKGRGFSLPAPLVAVARWAGPPLGLTGSVAGTILLLKASRRRRRRTNGSPTRRVAMGWAEVLDTARDTGSVVTPGTRREQARSLAVREVDDLALSTDAIIFGPGDPSDGDVDAYWAHVGQVRTALTRDMSRWRRARAALSLRSLVPALGHSSAPRAAGATS